MFRGLAWQFDNKNNNKTRDSISRFAVCKYFAEKDNNRQLIFVLQYILDIFKISKWLFSYNDNSPDNFVTLLNMLAYLCDIPCSLVNIY